jgi:fucose 4-O-acetylase-like acetyltransferase
MLSNEEATRQRLQWVDVLKGIGILAVVVAHIWQPSYKYLYLFHMPLFFFISGYLYKPVSDNKKYFQKKSLQLIVPYISFLLAIAFLKFLTSLDEQSFYESLVDFVKNLLKGIYGGKLLIEWFGVFWFITCLYLTQQLYNILYQRFGKDRLRFLILIILFYVLAYLNSMFFKNIVFPWSVNVVALAIAFYYSGHIYSSIIVKNKFLFLIPILCILISLVLNKYIGINLDFTMKNEIYGTPVISFAVAISSIVILQKIANIISMKNLSFLGIVLIQLGKASLVIMFLHQPIQLIMAQYPILNNDLIQIFVSIFVSLIVYKIFTHYSFTQKFFLGSFSQITK